MTFSFLTHSSPACALKRFTQTLLKSYINQEETGVTSGGLISTLIFMPKWPGWLQISREHTTSRQHDIKNSHSALNSHSRSSSSGSPQTAFESKEGLQETHETLWNDEKISGQRITAFVKSLKGSCHKNSYETQMNNFAKPSFVTKSFNKKKIHLISGLEDQQWGGMKGQGFYSMETTRLKNLHGNLVLHFGHLVFFPL